MNSQALDEDDTLRIVYERVMFQLNDTVNPAPVDAQSLADDSFSPETTARRIVGLATGFYGGYKELDDNRGLSEPAVLATFYALIGGAIDQGFAEARQFVDLFSAGSVPDSIARTIATTQDLVGVFLAKFWPHRAP